MSDFDKAIARIDAANAEDPHMIEVDGRMEPAELAYSRRMTEALQRLYPQASAELKLAARAQHIKRWTVPRSTYPMDRAGYLRWRNDLKQKHAELAGDILRSCGFDEAVTARVKDLIRKKDLKRDPDAQALEDVVCIVFLEHYSAAFAEKHEQSKLRDILRKTWGKMSDHGHEAALALELALPVAALISEVVATSKTTG